MLWLRPWVMPPRCGGRVHEDGVLRVPALGMEESLDALRQRWLARWIGKEAG